MAQNCMIVGNNAGGWGNGGGIYLRYDNSTLQNCLIANNLACTAPGGPTAGGGGVYIRDGGTIRNCTIVSNYTRAYGGGIFFNGGGTVENSIVYSNSASGGINYSNAAGGIFSSSCTLPDPGGSGNITNNPQFVNFSEGNYHLTVESPCLNTGSNQSWMTNAVDLDNRTRIRYGTVDRGAYETIYEGTFYRTH